MIWMGNYVHAAAMSPPGIDDFCAVYTWGCRGTSSRDPRTGRAATRATTSTASPAGASTKAGTSTSSCAHQSIQADPGRTPGQASPP